MLGRWRCTACTEKKRRREENEGAKNAIACATLVWQASIMYAETQIAEQPLAQLVAVKDASRRRRASRRAPSQPRTGLCGSDGSPLIEEVGIEWVLTKTPECLKDSVTIILDIILNAI
jgi:hypothetical protein